jgi:hypothetical protein
MPAAATANLFRALADFLAAYGAGGEMPVAYQIPRSQSTIAPLDIPTLYPAVNKSDEVRIVKVDEDEGLVFGWASVAATADGELVVDSHDEIIEPAELEKAAYEYVLRFGEAGVMHQGESVGRLVESLVLTPEKAAAMGIPAPMDTAWWIGMKIGNPEVFAKVKDGTYPMFSIQGLAQYEDIDE